MTLPAKSLSSASTETDQRVKVIVVEDDRDLNNLLKYTFETSAGYVVHSCFRGSDAAELIETTQPNIVILDLMLPDVSGTEVLRDLRRRGRTKTIPVILLTARFGEQDRVEGFEAGADDYVTKPFSPKELLLRVNAILRRLSNRPVSEVETPKEISIGTIKIVPEDFRVYVNSKPVSLTSTEFHLLLFLAERAGRLQSREILLQKVWGYEGNIHTRTVDTHVKRLRQKLGAGGDLIETVHGFGYQMLLSPKS